MDSNISEEAKKLKPNLEEEKKPQKRITDFFGVSSEKPREAKKEMKIQAKKEKEAKKKSVEEKLADYGYCIYHEKPGDFGCLRQIKDTTKGLEWPG